MSLPVPHFIEEDAYAPAEALEPETIRNWDFFVAELPECQAMETGHASYALREAQQNTRAYVLDVDLDYFSTWNPFRRGDWMLFPNGLLLRYLSLMVSTYRS